MIEVFPEVMRVSTQQAAKLAGIGQATLHRWIESGKLKAPKLTRVGGVLVRLLSVRAVDLIRRHKARFYCHGKRRRTNLHGK